MTPNPFDPEAWAWSEEGRLTEHMDGRPARTQRLPDPEPGDRHDVDDATEWMPKDHQPKAYQDTSPATSGVHYCPPCGRVGCVLRRGAPGVRLRRESYYQQTPDYIAGMRTMRRRVLATGAVATAVVLVTWLVAGLLRVLA